MTKNDWKVFKDPISNKNCFTIAEAWSLMERGKLWNSEMLNCLKPVRLAIEALSNHDANLTSEGIFKFLLVNWKNRILLWAVCF
jgi:hypothetical protein